MFAGMSPAQDDECGMFSPWISQECEQNRVRPGHMRAEEVLMLMVADYQEQFNVHFKREPFDVFSAKEWYLLEMRKCF